MSTAKSVNHVEIVAKLLETKAVDFDAIGRAVAEFGPSLALYDDPGEGFCGTNRFFLRLYSVVGPGLPVESLDRLSGIAKELG